ncbi:MAG: hypothetical protein P8J79_01745 [Halioglobus sp.]|nr:hypothetical protein [Halioglobus sp.]
MKAFILVLSLTLVASTVLAQSEAEPPGASRFARLQQMKKSLGLTDQQVSEIREIRQAGGSREDVRAVLSPEQQAKAVELRRNIKGKDASRKHRLQQLNLSDEQMTQIQSIRQGGGSRDEVLAVLTPEQQAKLVASHAGHKGADAPAEE